MASEDLVLVLAFGLITRHPLIKPRYLGIIYYLDLILIYYRQIKFLHSRDSKVRVLTLSKGLS